MNGTFIKSKKQGILKFCSGTLYHKEDAIKLHSRTHEFIITDISFILFKNL